MGLASDFDRRVQFQRATQTSDGGGGVTLEWAEYGPTIWALRTDVKDSEAILGGAFRRKLMTRFLVRGSEFTRTLTTGDRVTCDGDLFDVVSIKEPSIGRRQQLIEITGETLDDE